MTEQAPDRALSGELSEAPDPAFGADPSEAPDPTLAGDPSETPDPAADTGPSDLPDPAADTAVIPAAPRLGPAPDPAPAPVPVLRAEGLGLTASDGPVFADVSLDVWPARLTVITGRSGTGRSALLLALSGRLAGVTGRATFDGSTDLIARPTRVAARTSVARIGGLVELESQLTVGDSIVERALLDGVRAESAERTVRRLAGTFDRAFDPSARIAELGRLDQALLALALACVRPAALIVFDDVDRQLAADDQRELYAALGVVAASGPAVVATTVATDSIPPDADVIALPDRLARRTSATRTSARKTSSARTRAGKTSAGKTSAGRAPAGKTPASKTSKD